jgi:hypothetical protein
MHAMYSKSIPRSVGYSHEVEDLAARMTQCKSRAQDCGM